MEKNRALRPSLHRAYILGQQRFINYQNESEASPYPWDCAERSEFWRGFYDERDDLRTVMGAKA